MIRSGVWFDPEQCVDLPCKDLSFIPVLDLYLIFVRFCHKQQKWLILIKIAAFDQSEFIGSKAEAAKSCF